MWRIFSLLVVSALATLFTMGGAQNDTENEAV
jgi:hypothetical protein